MGKVVEREKLGVGTVQRGKTVIGDKGSTGNVEENMGLGVVHPHVVSNAHNGGDMQRVHGVQGDEWSAGIVEENGGLSYVVNHACDGVRGMVVGQGGTKELGPMEEEGPWFTGGAWENL
ncbi:hypothetical protein FH972_000798 [Carpinus fangiana]|uniref:Uncharacterized protein n=1 Tax=Carpinus fangiana TaxID=176857 RepID=A0A5N6QBM2_9ROSI|nr:hypothetical protein FH972_000798 [Carpinus fangiana]